VKDGSQPGDKGAQTNTYHSTKPHEASFTSVPFAFWRTEQAGSTFLERRATPGGASADQFLVRVVAVPFADA
jgi:hypothetical protein